MTNTIQAPHGDWEFEVTYPDGRIQWITVPAEMAGAVDVVKLAEVAERRPPNTLVARPFQPPGQ